MTLGELIDDQRRMVEDESIGVRRSWEDTFRYALRHFSPKTEIEQFDLDVLAARLADDGVEQRFVDGYIHRWRNLMADKREF